MATNVIKLQIIAKFQKLLNMAKKLQKLTKISNNVNKCQKQAKNGQNLAKFKNKNCQRFSGSKLPQKMYTVG